MITLNNGFNREGLEIRFETFPDGTLKMLDMPVFEPSKVINIFWKFENISEQVLLYNTVMYYRDHGHEEITLRMPYLPNARMDRVKENNECFTLKYFARFINSLNFKEVVIYDPHSDVGIALIDRVIVVHMFGELKDTVIDNGYDVICFPDAGAYKRYSSIFKFDKPYIYCNKMRDWKTGKLTGMTLVKPDDLDLTNKNVIIIDDICCRGGTFILAANLLKDAGANAVDLWVTHCEKTIEEGDVLKDDSPIRHVYTTDSLPNNICHEKLTKYKL